MTTDDVIKLWDSYFPSLDFPPTWILRHWRDSFSAEELDYAAHATHKALTASKIDNAAASRYMSGILKHQREQNADIDEALARRRPVPQEARP